MQITPRYDVETMQADMFRRGWLVADLAREALVSHMTVHRFFAGKHQTPRTEKKLAIALGKQPGHYLVKRRKVA